MFSDWQIFVPAVRGLCDNIIRVSYFVSIAQQTEVINQLVLQIAFCFHFIS